MKTKKIILFEIISFILMGIVIARYGINFENFGNYFTFFNEQIILLLTLILTLILVTGSYSAIKVISKKNLLRIPFFILLISTLFFIYRVIKIQEIIDVIILIGYIVLLLINLSMLKELFLIVRKVFLKKHS